MIIGVAGYAGAGKDQVGEFLMEMVPGAQKVAFAEPMKRIVAEVYDWPIERLDDFEFKETPDQRYVRLDESECANRFHWLGRFGAPDGGHWAWDELSGQTQVNTGLTKHEYADWVLTGEVHLSRRYALTRIGTQWGRDCYINTWADLALRKAKQHLADGAPLVFLPDCRFTNELEAIKAAGGEVWRVERPGLTAGTHASEVGCMALPVDRVIHNVGGLTHLREVVARAWREVVRASRPSEDEQ